MNHVSSDFGIKNENRQGANPPLTFTKQIEKQCVLLLKYKLPKYQKVVKLYEIEAKEYEENEVCEFKLLAVKDDY